MSAKHPAVTGLCERLRALWCGLWGIILYDLALIVKQFAHLADVEAGEGGIEAAII